MNAKRFLKILSIMVAMIFATQQCVFALPKVDEIVSGDVDIEYRDTNSMTINATDNTVINFSSFDILANESVIVVLPSTDSRILNRVTGNNSSDLLGTLNCNGLFVLVNVSGIHVGPAAEINAGSLILATRGITDTDFLKGSYVFEKMSEDQLDMLLLNEGKITVAKGGFGVLIAGAVENKGIIAAPAGRIVLAGADAVKLDITADGLISVAIEAEAASSILDCNGDPVTEQIMNTGTIEANGGMVILKAESVTDVFRKAINLDGFIMANRMDDTEGVVRIVADNDVDIDGEVKASCVEIRNTDEQAPIHVSMGQGRVESGSTHLFGDIVLHDFGCLTPGTGIYFEAGKTYTFEGRTKIQGEPGYDGLIELRSSEEGSSWYSSFSGTQEISYVAIQDAHNTGDAVKARPSTNRGNCVNWDTDPVWDGGGVTLYWSDSFNWDTNTVPTAFDVVTFDGTSTRDSIADAGFNATNTIATFDINAGYTGVITLETDLTVTGNYTQNAGTFNETVSYTGTNPFELTVNGIFSQPAGTFRDHSAGTAAVRVSSAGELQQIQIDGGAALAENYVQYGDIDLSGIANFDPIGDSTTQFTGTYNGNRYTISNLTIYRPEEKNVGLFGDISNAEMRNVSLESGSVTGLGSDIGALAGCCSGSTIVGSHAAVAVATAAHVCGTGIGGLIGSSSGSTITDSYTTGDIYAWCCGGGLVGQAQGTTITDCYATGTVTGTGDNSFFGGLVGGVSGNAITRCYATGDVSGLYGIGGLVSWSQGGTITDSYATGTVTGVCGAVGGLAGGGGGTITNCYATGEVIGPGGGCGSLVGSSGGTYSGNFWNTDTPSAADPQGAGTGITTAQMKTKSTFTNAGWDLDSTWNMIDGTTYPFLRWRYPAYVTGTTYSDQGSTVLGGAAVALAINGTLQSNTATADAFGFYYLLIEKAISDGDSLLAYIDNNVTKGNVVSVTSTSDIPDLDIYGSSIIARHDNAGPVTNSAFSAAKGLLADPDILYSVSGTTVDMDTDLLIWSGKTYAPGGDIEVSKDFINNGIFTPGSHTVTFDGSGTSLISGSSTFNNFTCTTPGKHLTFEHNRTQTITGTLTLNGQDAGTEIVLNSDDDTNRFTFNIHGSQDLSYVDVSNSQVDSTGGVFNINVQNYVKGMNTDADEADPRWKFISADDSSSESTVPELPELPELPNPVDTQGPAESADISGCEEPAEIINVGEAPADTEGPADTPDSTDTPDSADTPDSTDTANSSDTSDSTETENSVDTTDTAGTADSTETENSADTTDTEDSPDTEDPASSGDSTNTTADGTEESADKADISGFRLEEVGNQYKKRYTQGKYRTVVIVFEGAVVVSSYDEKGPVVTEEVFLSAGQETSIEGTVSTENSSLDGKWKD